MNETKLKQSEMAAVLGVPIDRIKNIRSGKVRSLTQGEAEALVKKLHIRGDWLATGQGPMFMSEAELEFYRRLDGVTESTNKSQMAGLTKSQHQVLLDIIYAYEIGNTEWLADYLQKPLSDEEKRLIEQFRRCKGDAKEAIKGMIAALAKSDSQDQIR